MYLSFVNLLVVCLCCYVHLSDVRQSKEHPDVDKDHEEDLKYHLSDDLLTQVQRSVDDYKDKLD